MEQLVTKWLHLSSEECCMIVDRIRQIGEKETLLQRYLAGTKMKNYSQMSASQSLKAGTFGDDQTDRREGVEPLWAFHCLPTFCPSSPSGNGTRGATYTEHMEDHRSLSSVFIGEDVPGEFMQG